MRTLQNHPEPTLLVTSKSDWDTKFQDDPTNNTNRFRYRELKKELLEETSNKCAYCESIVGPSHPGDVEHKTPTSVDISKHFCWFNLTIACNECNRRKRDYFDEALPFLDPYTDDVESRVSHRGPVVTWANGDKSAEFTVRRLELHCYARHQLIRRKIEKLNELDERIERYIAESNPVMKALCLESIASLANADQEFSAMMKTVIQQSIPEAFS